MKAPPLGPGGEDITWPDQVGLGSRKASSTRNLKPQNLKPQTHRAGTPVNRSQVAQDTAHTSTRRAAEGQERTNTPWVGRTGATQPTQPASGRSRTPRPLVRARPGSIGDYGKRSPEPWKQLMTGVPAHSLGGGRLPSSGAPQLEPQG